LLIILLPVSIVIFGPAATTWFKFLQNKIVLRNKNAEILARVAADQVLFAPTNLFFFLSSMAVMEGSSPKAKLDSTYKGALQTNWMVWPFVQVINFKFVPLHHGSCWSMSSPWDGTAT
jgi:protein Mpv17